MVVVLLPAYNEEASLPRLMPKLRDVLEGMNETYRVIVCDDGQRVEATQTVDRIHSAANDYRIRKVATS